MREIHKPFDLEQITELVGDDGSRIEVFLPENPRNRIPFVNEYCDFKPVGFARFEFGWMPLVYKVVTTEMESLGLRKNPNRMKFPVGEWVFEQRQLKHDISDDGGIWTALREGNVNTYKKYIMDKYLKSSRGFLTAAYNPVAVAGGYRVKSEGVMLIKEI